MDETTTNFAAKTEFVNVLLACPTMRDRDTRNQITDLTGDLHHRH